MPTNLAIDDKLLAKALAVSGMRTKRAAVNAALEEFVRRRQQLAIVDLFGKVSIDDAYDYKAQRKRK